jgi:Family of unknown function (DUF6535)
LFSASVAALVAVSVQDLRPNPQDTSAFYLANIYQLLADPNVSRASILSTQNKPPPFSPPTSGVWVNSLWFLSLVISLTCALLATLLQQWARRYVRVTQPPRYSPHKRAPIRAFFADGVERFYLPSSVEALPALLHLSLFLFLFGLVIFLFSINHTVFNVVVWWVGLALGAYTCITLMPIFRHDSPYYAPLSSSAWFFCSGILNTGHQIVRVLRYPLIRLLGEANLMRFVNLRLHYRMGMAKGTEGTASKLSAEISSRILTWIFQALDEDHELEQFFECIPSFCRSNVVTEARPIFAKLGNETLARALAEFLDRTWSSSLLLQTFKERRLMVCMQAADALDLPFPTLEFFTGVYNQTMDGAFLQSVRLGHSLRSRCYSSDSRTASYAQGIVAGIIATVPERDDRWMALVMDQLSISGGVLRYYLTHGDSVLLANFTHIIRQFIRFSLEDWWTYEELGLILPIISKFDIRNTLPGLQHDFCALWNEVTQATREACDRGYIPSLVYLLGSIRHIYSALHQGTDALPTPFSWSTNDNDSILVRPYSYPLCNIPGHHQADVSATGETTHPPPHHDFPNA